jgi:nucleoid DNA-binding protein
VDRARAGRRVEVADLGSFTVRTYKAYDGRDRWTGATIRVPETKLPFFKVAKATLEFANGSGIPPQTDWVAALITRLTQVGTVPFGRVGAFVLRTKRERHGFDPQRNSEIVIPARNGVTCQPSRQINRAMNGLPELPLVDSRELAAALDRLPPPPTTTLAELHAALASAGLDPSLGGLAPPGREYNGDTVVALDLGGHPQWLSDGVSVFEIVDDEERVDYQIAEWAPDMLVVAAVRALAHEKSLSGLDVQRVLAQLSPKAPFWFRALPF